MQLSLKYDLPFVTVEIAYKDQRTEIPHVLVDTGSGSTVMSADMVAKAGIFPSPEDVLYNIRGVGGNEAVFSRKVDFLQIGERRMAAFEIEIGGMDYGFEINGILGMDFLLKAGAIINLQEMKIEFVGRPS